MDQELSESTRRGLFGDRPRVSDEPEAAGDNLPEAVEISEDVAQEVGALFVDGNEAADDDQQDVGQDIMDLQLGELDLTTMDIDFDEVDDDLKMFQSDELVQEALAKGVDLRNYARQIEADLGVQEAKCIENYLAGADELAALHGHIQSCDGILEKMQNMLSTFQGNLGHISSEIKDLQDRSTSMDVKVRNRAAADKKLGKFVDAVLVSETLVNAICKGEVDEDYVEHLDNLNRKVVALRQPELHDTRAAEDVRPTVERLRLKAIQRVRASLLERLHSLRKPKTNIQIKQKLLLKSKRIYHFLLDCGGGDSRSSGAGAGSGASVGGGEDESRGASAADVVQEIRTQYTETMSKMYLSKFKLYLTNMRKLQSDPAIGKIDLLGMDESKTGGLFVTKRTAKQMVKIFSLGQRINVLGDVAEDFIIHHVAQQSGQRFSFERIFRSALRLLMDSAMSEYDFIVDFFGEAIAEPRRRTSRAASRKASLAAAAAATAAAGAEDKQKDEGRGDEDGGEEKKAADGRSTRPVVKKDRDSHLFTQVFAKTMDLFLSTITDHLFVTNDFIGVLLLVRVLKMHNDTMQRNRTHCLDAFFDRMNILLWPRLQRIFDANLDSVKQLKPANKKSSVRTQYLATRFGHFGAAILRLNQGHDDGILVNNLTRLRDEVERYLKECAARISNDKNRLIFLINNYNGVLAIFGASGVMDTTEGKHWRTLAGEQVAAYVEEELQDKFGRMVDFVKSTELELAESGGEAKPDEGTVQSLVKHFASHWRDGIDNISKSVSKNFTIEDPQDDQGTEILKQTLVQLVLYYQRFQDILKKVFVQQQPAFVKELVPIPTIMYEIKKQHGRK